MMTDEAAKTENCTEVNGQVDPLVSHLRETNEVLRSAYQIAQRGGKETNWAAFTKRLEGVLKRQHALLYPNREHEASASCWCHPEIDYVDPATGNTVYVHKRPN